LEVATQEIPYFGNLPLGKLSHGKLPKGKYLTPFEGKSTVCIWSTINYSKKIELIK